MIRLLTLTTLTAVAAAAVGTPVRAAEVDKQALAAQARLVLKLHCSRCHHGEGSEGGNFDALKDKTLTAEQEDDKPYIIAGKPNESRLLKRIEKGEMPPKTIKSRPTDAEKTILRKWIEAGAPPFATVETREYVSQKAVLTAVRDHLRAADERTKPFLRYFSLANLSNSPKETDGELRIQRAALSKAVNSLSTRPRIVLPKAVDKDGIVFAIDLRDYGWDKKDLWTAILRAYPYGLRYDKQADAALADLDKEVTLLTNDEGPIIRADWFVATATRPPLYHTLLQLPKTAGELEKSLAVNVIDDINRDQVKRAAFQQSGVSAQNRLIERHDASNGGWYWKSYDFKANNNKNDLLQFPLGPKFKDNPFDKFAFVHDGGEILFMLQNGLQGYYLINGKDERIDQGPEEVVNDSLRTSGTPAIVTGLSCMACHSQGIIKPPKDRIRSGAGVFGDAKKKVLALYPDQDDMDKQVREDQEQFLKILDKTTGKFLRTEADKAKNIRDFPEVIGEVARQYKLTDLDLKTAAAELDIKPDDLKTAITNNQQLQKLGLKPLLEDNGVVKRQEWENIGARSLFQRVALELGKGSPLNVVK